MYLFAANGSNSAKLVAVFTVMAVIMSISPVSVFAQDASDVDESTEPVENIAKSQVEETEDDENHLEVTICHSAGQSGNYTLNTVDEDSIEGINGHGFHEDDIIPPFGDFLGLNWDDEGQAIWDNDCEVPDVPTDPVIDPENGTSTENSTSTDTQEESDEEETPTEVLNTCLIPDSLGDTSEFELQSSGEKTIGQMLADHGYAAIDTTLDQVNYQVWNLTDTEADSVTFSLRVLGKRAGNTQIVGYYKAGDVLTFTSVLTQTLDTDGEASVSVTIPATFADSFGFALQSADKTWFSEIALNSDGADHVAVYNPSSNVYLLGFEDFNNLGDSDYNDIVIEITDVTCNTETNPDPETKTISGYKFNDENGDGEWDEGEEGLPGWEIVLEGEDEEDVRSTTTDSTGYYSFVVGNGSYQVTETNQKGWEQTALIGDGADGDTCYITVSDELLSKLKRLEWLEDDYTCDFGNQEVEVDENPTEVLNTCLIPDSLGDTSEFELQSSGEKTVDQMLADHGYAAIDTTLDQVNYQVWNLTDTEADSVTFSLRVLGKRAGNTQIVGYYKAGDDITFTQVLTQGLDTDGESAVSVTIPAEFADSFGFALQSDDKTWFSEQSLNSDGEDHVAVYNPVANTYLLAFEDFNNLGDSDYNDIVIEIDDVTCDRGTDGGDGDGDSNDSDDNGGSSSGTRVTKRAPRGEVLGASTSTPAGLVLGESTSTIPVGAPNTGAGGMAPVSVSLPVLYAVFTPTTRLRNSK